MMEDYETGLHRGRSSRHGMGRFRWILVFSLAANLFLSYKLYRSSEGHKKDVSELQTRNSMMHKNLEMVREKQGKLDQDISDLETQKTQCSKLLSEAEDARTGCEKSRKECQANLDVASSKLIEASDELHKSKEEKDEVNSKLESCVIDLNQAKENIDKLNTDLVTEQRKFDATKREEQSKDVVEPIKTEDTRFEGQSKEAAEQSLHEVKPNVEKSNVTELKKEETMVVDGGENKLSDPEIACRFNEELEKQESCNHYEDLPNSGWKTGSAPFIEGSENLCLYIDELSALPSGAATLIFTPSISGKCVEVSITFFVSVSGLLAVGDGDKMIEMPTTDGYGWHTHKVHFQHSPPHVIKIIGTIQGQGGVGISGLTISKIDCSGNVEDLDRKTDVDKEAIEELVQ